MWLTGCQNRLQGLKNIWNLACLMGIQLSHFALGLFLLILVNDIVTRWVHEWVLTFLCSLIITLLIKDFMISFKCEKERKFCQIINWCRVFRDCLVVYIYHHLMNAPCVLDLLTVKDHIPSPEPQKYEKKGGQWYNQDDMVIKNGPQGKHLIIIVIGSKNT